MNTFGKGYEENAAHFRDYVRADDSMDIVVRELKQKDGFVTVFYIDGFVKDGDLQKLLAHLLSSEAPVSADAFIGSVPIAESCVIDCPAGAARALFSGQAVFFGTHFGEYCCAVDVRHYPGREVGEPESDKVMQGARDGFVETLITNTVLIRRRIRDTRLTVHYENIGGASGTDVAVVYMDGVADEKYVREIIDRLRKIRPKSLTLGFQSLAESLIPSGWWNPFPKIRTTERPDTAAAQVLEGSVLVLVDTSPQVMILPTSLLDYLQQTDDYYYPPLTGSYLRIVRTAILLLSVVSTPLWYLALMRAQTLPDALQFLIPKDPGALPILFQLYLAEITIDGLKIASMNTPDMLSNSLSVIGALILGDFAVGVGWFCQDVILYMALVAIANFAQQNHELGYAFKFMRMVILAFTALAGEVGFLFGIGLFCVAAGANCTVSGRRRYLYPLIPFDGKALSHLIFRTKKNDFETEPLGASRKTAKKD